MVQAWLSIQPIAEHPDDNVVDPQIMVTSTSYDEIVAYAAKWMAGLGMVLGDGDTLDKRGAAERDIITVEGTATSLKAVFYPCNARGRNLDMGEY